MGNSKQLLEKAKHIIYYEVDKTGHGRIPIYGYRFTKDEMQEFIDTLCKEQRHECQIERNKRSVCIKGEWYIHCEDILNAPKPDTL